MSLRKKVFQDNTGKYVVAQPPNVMVYVMLFSIIGGMLTSDEWREWFDLLFFGAAFTWSYLEIRFGESVFRRILGVLVAIGIFIGNLL